MDPDPGEFQDPRHCFAELFLHVVGRSGVVFHEVLDVGLRQRLAVQFARCFQRYGVDMHIVGGDHVVGQALHKLLPQRGRIHLDVRGIVGAQEALAVLVKTSGGSPVNAQRLLDGGFDLGRLDAVAVDLDHISAAAQQDQIAVFVLACEVAGVIQSAAERVCRLLRQIDIAADVGVYEAQFAGLAVRDFVSVFIQQMQLRLHLGMTDGANLIGLVDLEEAHRKAALAGGVDVDEVEVLVVEIVRGLAADEQHPQKRTGLVAQLPDVGRRQEGDGDPLHEEELRKRARVLDRGV